MTLIKSVYLAALTSFLAGSVFAQTAPQYGQCGGSGWTGPTTCPAGWTCTATDPVWYSQCLPGSVTATLTTTTTKPVSSGGTGSTSASSTSTAAGGSATLAPGFSFIRSVEAPTFHQYLESQVLWTASPAVVGDYTNAAQFQVVNGQLIQNGQGTNLYATVEPRANSTVVKLAVSWSTKPDTLGTFVFSGDSLEWSSPNVTRQQNNAWLVCPSGTTQLIYINLGAYAFMTPAGCSDTTLNAYTGATAVP